MSNVVTLRVNGRVYSGWTDVSIAVSLQSLARSFSVSSTRAISDAGDLAIGVACGDDVEVMIGDDLVCTGYITDRVVSYDSSSIRVSFRGKSKPVDLEECCLPERATKEFSPQTHAKNLAAVCGFFGIDVVDEVGSTTAAKFDIKVTETVQTALVRYLKAQSILLCDDEAGRVVICSVGSGGHAADSLRLGVNVLSGERSQSFKDRFSRVVAVGQSANPLSQAPVTANQVSASADDTDVSRERVLVVQMSGSATPQKARARAQLIMNAGRGKCDASTYTVHGWRQSDGTLWKINSFVSISDAYAEIVGDRLITGVTMTLSAAGMRTQLECKPASSMLSTDERDDADSAAKSSQSSKTRWSDIKKPAAATGGEWTTR